MNTEHVKRSDIPQSRLADSNDYIYFSGDGFLTLKLYDLDNSRYKLI